MQWINIQKSSFEEGWGKRTHIKKVDMRRQRNMFSFRVFPRQARDQRCLSIEGRRDVVTFIGSPISGTILSSSPPPYSSHLYRLLPQLEGTTQAEVGTNFYMWWLNFKISRSSDAPLFQNWSPTFFFWDTFYWSILICTTTGTFYCGTIIEMTQENKELLRKAAHKNPGGGSLRHSSY